MIYCKTHNKIEISNKLCKISYSVIGFKKFKIFYHVNSKVKNFVVNDDTHALALLTLPSMHFGKTLYFKGNVSEKLNDNIKNIIYILLKWKIGLKQINVVCEEKNKDQKIGNSIGLFFSGGVDSFCALLRWNKKNPSRKITHLILVHGFDIDVKNNKLFSEVNSSFQKICKKVNITGIVVKTNLRSFTDEYISWDYAHGPALASVALLLRNGFKKIIIPSTNSTSELFPWGSHPDLDPLWSTENMTVIHDHNDLNRLQKVKQYISKSDIALKYLRVCWKNKEYNCCVCDKCLRTMIELKIAGVLDKAVTFKKPLDLNLVRKIRSHGKGSWIHLEDCLFELKKMNIYPEIQEALEYSLYNSKHPNFKRSLMNYVNELDSKYNQHRLYKYLLKNKLLN